jgi:hypothetical protein
MLSMLLDFKFENKKDLRSEAEARIYDLLNSKIDELLDLSKLLRPNLPFFLFLI